jgi:hypothetical protein
MAKGLFRAAAAESELVAGVEGGGRPTRSGTPLDGT